MSVIVQGNTVVQGRTRVGQPNALLYDYPNASAAYSVRRLNVYYSGSALRVRRSSDNTEQDIGFDSLGNLDETALTTFVGANSGFVTKWYDQSGNGRDAAQATSASQPRIVNAGTIEKQNNKPAINFNVAARTLQTSINILNSSPITFTASFGQVPSGGDIFGNRGVVGGGWIYRLLTLFGNIGNGNATITNSSTSKHIVFGIRNSSSQNTFWINSTNQSTTSTAGYTPTNPSGIFSIGSDGQSGSSFTTGYIHEFIGWESDQSSNRTGIESNINSYYSIY